MGIKKNAYLRDFVRTIIALELEKEAVSGSEYWRELIFKEVEPLYHMTAGNADEAAKMVLHPTNKSRYPTLTGDRVAPLNILKAIDMVVSTQGMVKLRAEPEHFIKAFSIVEPNYAHVYLGSDRVNSKNVREVYQVIDRTFDELSREYTRGVPDEDITRKKLMESLHEIVTKHITMNLIADLFKNLNTYINKLEKHTTPVHASCEGPNVRRVVLSYIDSLDRGA